MTTLLYSNLIGRLTGFGIGLAALAAVAVPAMAQPSQMVRAIPSRPLLSLEASAADGMIGNGAPHAVPAFLDLAQRPALFIDVADSEPAKPNSMNKGATSQSSTSKDAKGKSATDKAPSSKGKTRRVCGSPK